MSHPSAPAVAVPAVLEAAAEALRAGWQPLPLRPGAKEPAVRDWTSLRLTAADLPRAFAGGANLGLLLGAPSGGLVDVDLDTPEAVAVAGELLPNTARISGRSQRPRSHYWYVVPEPPGRASARYEDPLDGKVLVELRSTGGQTAVPPSQVAGDRYLWHATGSPARVPAVALQRRVAMVAVAALIARHWPVAGGRHAAALGWAGLLVSGGLAGEQAARLLRTAAAAGGDTEVEDRARAARTTAARLAEGKRVRGAAALAQTGIDPRLPAAAARWLGLHAPATTPEPAPEPAGEERGKSRRDGDAAVFVALATEEADLFHTPQAAPYLTFSVDGRRETHPLRAERTRLWLTRGFYRRHGRAPAGEALRAALEVLAARAVFDCPERTVAVRIAQLGSALYIDRGGRAGGCIEVTADGWRLCPEPPDAVRFRRPVTAGELPEPVAGGRIEELRPFVNAGSDDGFTLIVGWLLQAVRADGPYLALLLEGTQGAAKSTTARVLRALVDPSLVELRAEPRDERDLMIAAQSRHVLAFDNISRLTPALSDAFCRMATGGGFGTRKLYEDSEEVVLDAVRPLLLTGIGAYVEREDLLDRALTVTLPPIPESARRPEQEVGAGFDAARPRILGALLDGVSRALRDEEQVRPARLPRMADAARWVAAGMPALGAGWSGERFLAAYAASRRSADEQTLEHSAVARAVLARAERGPWQGTAAQLLAELAQTGDITEVERRSRLWPSTPGALATALRRIQPALLAAGVRVETGLRAHGGRRLIVISPAPGDDGDDGDGNPQNR